MRSFQNCNPIVITVYFLSVIGILMFSQNPILLLLGFIGVFSYTLMKSRLSVRSHLFYFLLFSVLTLINPLMSHNGRTVLFVVNDSPITLESLVYGRTLTLRICKA